MYLTTRITHFIYSYLASRMKEREDKIETQAW